MPDLYGHLTPQGVLNGSLQTIVFADNYNDLTNKPSINSVELQGNKTAADLGLLTAGDIPVDSVNGKQGVVILDGDDIEYEAGTSVNSKIADLEAEIGSGPVVSVNGQQGVVELDGTDINYSLTKTLNQKIDEVAASIPVVNYPVTSVNTKTGDVVLDGDDIDYAEGVTVNEQIGTNTADIGTNATAIGSLSSLTTTDKSSLVGAVNELTTYIPVWNNTASGAIATFDTSLALPLQDCTIAINAVQEGTGTPSPDNVRPISGFTGANIKAAGKNLALNELVTGTVADITYTNNNDGTFTVNGTATRDSYRYLTQTAQKSFKGNFVVSINIDSVISGIWSIQVTTRYLSDDNVKQRVVVNAITPNKAFTIDNDEYFSDIVFRMSSGSSATNAKISVQLEVGDTASEFEQYNGTTAHITWQDEAGTVYGGSLDVTSGVLTINRAIVDMGTLSWTKNTITEGNLFRSGDLSTALTYNSLEAICEIYPTVMASERTDISLSVGSNHRVDIIDNNYSDAATFKTAVTGHNICYPLATPQTYQLTPTQISAIVGTNNVFTDTNGNTSVVYACSLKDYIEGQ